MTSRPHALLRTFRLFHLYLGIFTAPAILFFAFTGALQTFSLHETTAGSSYQPPKWAVTLAQIHKKATPVVPPKKQPLAAAPSADHHAKDHADTTPDHANDHAAPPAPAPHAPSAPAHNPLPLKIFFLIVAIGLVTSTLTGLYMSWKFNQRNHLALVLLFLAGIVIPLLCIFI